MDYTDDTILISTINTFDNYSTGVNNQELTNIHNLLLVQRLNLNVSKFIIFQMSKKSI